MEFKNPWGKGSSQFDKWFQNPWKPEAINSTDDSNTSIVESKSDQKIALVFWGGARLSSHNNTFKNAAVNTQKSYGSTYTKSMIYATSGVDVVMNVNSQSQYGIGRMDILTHSSSTAFYMVRNKTTGVSGEKVDIPEYLVESNNLYASLDAYSIESWGGGDQTSIIDLIAFDRFAKEAVVEFHGCNVASAPYELVINNIVERFSKKLYNSGAIKAVVIGHATEGLPNINGKNTQIGEDDYRWQERLVYHDGEILFRTNVKGHIGKDVIKIYLAKKDKAFRNNERYEGYEEIYEG